MLKVEWLSEAEREVLREALRTYKIVALDRQLNAELDDTLARAGWHGFVAQALLDELAGR